MLSRKGAKILLSFVDFLESFFDIFIGIGVTKAISPILGLKITSTHNREADGMMMLSFDRYIHSDRDQGHHHHHHITFA